MPQASAQAAQVWQSQFEYELRIAAHMDGSMSCGDITTGHSTTIRNHYPLRRQQAGRKPAAASWSWSLTAASAFLRLQLAGTEPAELGLC